MEVLSPPAQKTKTAANDKAHAHADKKQLGIGFFCYIIQCTRGCKGDAEFSLESCHRVIVSNSTSNRGCFAIDFDAQAHCIKINVKTGVWMVGLIQLRDFQRPFIFGCIMCADMQ